MFNKLLSNLPFNPSLIDHGFGRAPSPGLPAQTAPPAPQQPIPGQYPSYNAYASPAAPQSVTTPMSAPQQPVTQPIAGGVSINSGSQPVQAEDTILLNEK